MPKEEASKDDDASSANDAKDSVKGGKLLDSQEKTYVFYKSCGGDARETLGPKPMLDILQVRSSHLRKRVY